MKKYIVMWKAESSACRSLVVESVNCFKAKATAVVKYGIPPEKIFWVVEK